MTALTADLADILKQLLAMDREQAIVTSDDELVTAWQVVAEEEGILDLIKVRLGWIEMEAASRTKDWGVPLEGDTARLYREQKNTHAYDADKIEAALKDVPMPPEQYAKMFVPQPDKFLVSEAKKLAKRSPAIGEVIEAHHDQGTRPGPIQAEFKEPAGE